MAQTNTVPYLTEDQIRKNYQKYYTDYAAQRQDEANRAIASANSQYDNAQRQNYVNYRMNQRELPQMLANQGITGGASETSALRARTNYENNFGNTERERASNIGNINNTLADALATYRMTADQNMNNEIAENKQLQANYEQQQRQIEEERFANNISGYRTTASIDKAIEQARASGENWKIPYLRNQRTVIIQQNEAKQQAEQERKEQRFANTISGYNTISGIDKKIASIRKSGKDTWRIPYLRARRAELVAAGQTASSSGSGSGSGGGRSGGGSSSRGSSSSGRSSGGGKSGSGSGSKGMTKDQAVKEVRKAFGISGKSGKNNSKGTTKSGGIVSRAKAVSAYRKKYGANPYNRINGKWSTYR